MTNHGTSSPNVYLLQVNGKFCNVQYNIPIQYQYQLMEIYTPLGPTIKEQALRSCLGVLSPFSYCPHSENTVAWI